MARLEEDSQDLTNWILSDMSETTRSLGYTPIRFLHMVHKHGGAQACRQLLRPEIPASIGFCRLRKLGLLDISVEQIALSEKWKHLFNDGERATAQFRLDNADEICSDPSLIGE
jgi:hypothetical protein